MVKPRYKQPSKNFTEIAKPLSIMDIRGSSFNKKGVSEVYQLKVDSIDPYEKQSRKKFNEEELNNLASSIQEVGILSPLLVIRSSEKDKFFVINGERRLRAAKMLQLSQVPCIIEDNVEKSEIIALIDNIQRADLHPIELAGAYASLLCNPTYSDKKEFSRKIGVGYTTMLETLKLNDLPEEIKSYSLDNNVKGRALFRKLLKCKNLEEMESLLGVRKSKSSIRRRKNILNASIINGQVEIKFFVKKITEKQKKYLIDKFNEYLNKIDIISH